MPDAPHSDALVADSLEVEFRQGRKTRIRALDHVSFRIREGDIFGLLGPNGAGKSTAMYCFLGLLRPQRGQVTLLGKTPSPGADVFEDIAYLPEEPHYHPYLSVQEAVRFYGSLYRRALGDAEVASALDAVGLGDYSRLRLSKCSKGMKQKVGLAACMLFVPRLLFLDEPTRGLDPIMVRKFRDHLLRINAQGTTIILNSHILSEVELICSRVAIMNKGRVVADDAPDNLIRRDSAVYEVVTDAAESFPDYVEPADVVRGTMTGSVPADRLEAFVHHCQSTGIRLLSCRLRTETLEDVFMRVIES